MPSASKPRRRTSSASVARGQQDQELETIRLINEAMAKNDLHLLRQYASVRGLVNHQLRAAAWPLLLCGTAAQALSAPSLYEPGGDYERWAAAPHRNSSTVAVDVERSLWAFTRGWSDAERAVKRAELGRLLNAVVNYHGATSVFYYQGLHDVASVLLLVAGSERAAFPLLAHLTTCHLRDCTRSGMDPVIEVLPLLLPIVDVADAALGAHVRSLCPEPHFALSWVLTWFSHDSTSLADAARLFDLFLASHPLMPLYLGAATMRGARASLLCCGDMPELYTALKALRPGGGGGGGGTPCAGGHSSDASGTSSGRARGMSGSDASPDGASSAAAAAAAWAGNGSSGGGLSLNELAAQALHLFRHQAPPATLVARVRGPILMCVTPAAELHLDAWHVPTATPPKLSAAAGSHLRPARFGGVLRWRDGGRGGVGGPAGSVLTIVVMAGLSIAALFYQSSRGQPTYGAEQLLGVVLQGVR